jgi:hypothetical protein
MHTCACVQATRQALGIKLPPHQDMTPQGLAAVVGGGHRVPTIDVETQVLLSFKEGGSRGGAGYAWPLLIPCPLVIADPLL